MLISSLLGSRPSVICHTTITSLRRVPIKRRKVSSLRKSRNAKRINGLKIYYNTTTEKGTFQVPDETEGVEEEGKRERLLADGTVFKSTSSIGDSTVARAIENMFKVSDIPTPLAATHPVDTDDPHKFDSLAQQLTGVTGTSILPAYTFNPNLPTPFQIYKDNKHRDRLSVTKILPNYFCELKEMFKLYGNYTEKRTEAMKRGTTQHRIVELQTNPVKTLTLTLGSNGTHVQPFAAEIDLTRIQDVDQFLVEERYPFVTEDLTETDNVVTSEDEASLATTLDELAYLLSGRRQERDSPNHVAVVWSRNFMRLTELFFTGEASEIIIHGIYLPSQHRLLSSDNQDALKNEDHYTLTGIIDKLSLMSTVEDAKELYFQAIRDAVVESGHSVYNLSSLLPIISEVSKEWCDVDEPMVYLSVKDLKTRAQKTLPPTLTQVTSRAQVFVYRALLGALTSENSKPQNAKVKDLFAYKMMLKNLENRGIDPDTAISPALAIYLGLNNKYILNDFSLIQRGNPIGFEPYDDYMKTYQPSSDYTLHPLSKLKYSPPPKHSVEEMILSSINPTLFAKWKKPLTYRYLVARNAQLYSMMSDFLSPATSVEYFAVDEVFNEIEYTYQPDAARNVLEQGMKLWLGNRVPMKPRFKGLCKNCDFRLQCEFNREQLELNSSISNYRQSN